MLNLTVEASLVEALRFAWVLAAVVADTGGVAAEFERLGNARRMA